MGRCVSRTDPEWGCGSASCDRCSLLNAKNTCSPTAECAIESCRDNFIDCDGDVSNGCEDIRTSVDNCGECGLVCPAEAAHTAKPACGGTAGADGQLTFRCGFACQDGYVDADEDPSNGCEKPQLVTSDERCPTRAPADASTCDQDHFGSTCTYSHPEISCTHKVTCIVPLDLTAVPYWRVLGDPCQ